MSSIEKLTPASRDEWLEFRKTVSRKGPTIIRFEASFIPEPNSGCWLWECYLNNKGYGAIYFGAPLNKTIKAHRAAWLLYRGDIGDSHVLHRCDNRLCVNPDHLFLGTNADNVSDRVAKGRGARMFGPINPKFSTDIKLDENSVREIRAMCGSTYEIAKIYGVSQSLISMVRRREVWCHVD